MSERLKSNDAVTKGIGKRLKQEKENQVSGISLAGKTNLPFRANLQNICEEAKSVSEAYLEACRLNGEAITVLGDSFESVESWYAGKMK